MIKENERFNAILSMVSDIIKNPDKYPDKFIPISLTNKEITEIFTPKRTELIHLIKKKQPITVSKLAKLTRRNVMGVIRDTSILKKSHIVSSEKRGKEVILTIKQDFLIIPILTPLTLKEIESRKQLAVV